MGWFAKKNIMYLLVARQTIVDPHSLNEELENEKTEIKHRMHTNRLVFLGSQHYMSVDHYYFRG